MPNGNSYADISGDDDLLKDNTSRTYEIKGKYGPDGGSVEVVANNLKEKERYEEHSDRTRYNSLLDKAYKTFTDTVFNEKLSIPIKGDASQSATYREDIDERDPDLQDENTSYSDNQADELSAPSQVANYDTGPSEGGVLQYDPNFSDAQFLAFNDSLSDDDLDYLYDSMTDAQRRAYSQRAVGLNNARAEQAAVSEESGVLDGLQTALDVGGLTPGVGIVADGANTLISAARGRWVEAGFNLFAMIPIFGQGTKSAQLAAKIAKAADKADDVADAAKAALKAADAAKDAKKGKGAFQAAKRVTGDALKAARRAFNKVKPQAWLDEAAKNPGKYSADQLKRMREGLAPIGKDGFPMEIHHRTPLAEGGSNLFDNFDFMTRTDHRLGPNYKINHPNLP